MARERFIQRKMPDFLRHLATYKDLKPFSDKYLGARMDYDTAGFLCELEDIVSQGHLEDIDEEFAVKRTYEPHQVLPSTTSTHAIVIFKVREQTSI